MLTKKENMFTKQEIIDLLKIYINLARHKYNYRDGRALCVHIAIMCNEYFCLKGDNKINSSDIPELMDESFRVDIGKHRRHMIKKLKENSEYLSSHDYGRFTIAYTWHDVNKYIVSQISIWKETNAYK